MKTFFVRTALCIALPFLLPWAFVSRFFQDIRSAFWYAWQEVRIEADIFSQLWDDAGRLS